MPGSTRATLRQNLGDLMGLSVRSTTSAAGTTSTLIDTNRLLQADDWWNSHGRNLIITSGTLSGTILQSTDFANSTSTVTFAPTQASAPGSAASYEVYREFTVDEIHAAINQAIRRCWPWWYGVNEDTTLTTGTGTNRWTRVITALSPEPELKTGYYKVEIEWNTSVATYPYKDWTDFCSLRHDDDAFTIQFFRLPPESRTIRVVYAFAPTEMTTEAGTTGVDRETNIDEFIYAYARSTLWGMRVGEQAERERLRWADEADRIIREKSMKPFRSEVKVSDPELSWLAEDGSELDKSENLAIFATPSSA